MKKDIYLKISNWQDDFLDDLKKEKIKLIESIELRNDAESARLLSNLTALRAKVQILTAVLKQLQ